MIIDGTNVIDMGVVVGDRSPSRSAATTAQIIEGAPGAWRRNRLGRQAPEALGISVSGAIVGSTPAVLRSNIDKFKFAVRPDREMTIRWSDQIVDSPIREWIGYRQSLTVDDIVPGWVTEAVKFDLGIVCPDPFAREATLQSAEDNTALPNTITPTVGTAPMPVIITLTGNTASPLVNPVLHYRDGDNNDIVTLSLTDTLDGGTETVVIDTEFYTAIKNATTNVGGLISGSYFDVNPGDGDYLGSPNAPDIYLTADSGAVDLFRVQWKRRYW